MYDAEPMVGTLWVSARYVLGTGAWSGLGTSNTRRCACWASQQWRSPL